MLRLIPTSEPAESIEPRRVDLIKRGPWRDAYAHGASEALEPLLLHGNRHVRVRAAYALAAGRVPVDPTPLVSLLDSDDPSVRAEAVGFLVRLGDEAGIREARALLDDPSPVVREHVRRMLDEHGGR